MKSLILVLFFGIIGTSSISHAGNRTLNSFSSSDVYEYACNAARAYRAETCNGKCSLSMGGLKEPFKSSINNLYRVGIIDLAGYNTAISRLSILDSRNFWRKRTRGKKKHMNEACGNGKSAMAAILNGLRTPACKNTGDMATAGQCCLVQNTMYDNYKLTFAEYEPQNSCKRSNKACSKHEDCCSEFCNIKDGETVGKCEIEQSCYVPHLEGEQCPLDHPYCESCLPEDNPDYVEGCKSTTCLPINHSSSGMNDYAVNGQACEDNEDCASDSCVGGKCQYKAVCTICTPRGKVISNNETCCPGLYPNTQNRCVTTLPPFVLPSNVKATPKKKETKEESAIKTVLDLLSYLNPLPSAHAQRPRRDDEFGSRGSDPNNGTSGGNGSSGSSGSGGSNGSGGSGGGECLGYGSDGLTADQRKEWEGCMKTAVENNGEGRQEMMGMCDRQKIQYLEDNRKKKAGNQKIGNGQDCDGGGQLTRSDYANLYDVPAITSKTFSDVKECEFNSFNDSWRSASNMERNAEITLRAFEAVYSGEGTIDYIVDGGGKSIYERAQKVALKLREYRYELIKSFQELDQKMSCKCLAIFGPNNNWEFKNNTLVVNSIQGTQILNKREYFNQFCEGEKDYIQEDDTRDVEEGSGGDGLASENSFDGEKSGGDADETEKKLVETDKGAIGLSHEKLIVEWLNLKREVQMDRFKDNSDLEEQLQELTEFIENYDWINNEGHYYNREGGAYLEYLYNYGVRRLAGWIAIVLTIIAIAISFIPGLQILGMVWLNAVVFGLGGFFLGGLLSALFEKGPTAPKVIDTFLKDKTTKRILGVPIFKAKYYRREYRTEWFDNKHLSSQVVGTKKHCEVHSTNGSCVRSVYRINHKYNDDMNFENYPLLDPVLPVTGKRSDFNVVDTHRGKSYADLMEEAYWNGIDALKATKPGTKGSCSGKHSDPKYGSIQPCVKASSSFVSYDPISDEDIMKKFGIDDGEWVPEDFNTTMQKKFKKSIVKYAMCRKLAGEYKGAPCVTMKNMEEDVKAVGFGYLFEQEKDARDFAEYTYSVHFVWPHLTAENKLGYPLLGQEAYFANILYNLKLVGSIALKRALESYGAYSLYKSSYDKRKGDYAALRGSEEGEGSRNAGFPDRVYAEFQGLNFNNDVNMDAFSAKMKDLSNDKSFDEASQGLFETASRAFKRRSNDIKKRQEFDKKFGNSKRGKKKKRNIASFANAVNSPLKNMSLNVGRQNLGNVSGALFGADMKSKDTQSPAADESKKSNTVAAYTPPKIDLNSFDSNSYGSGYGSGSSYGSDSSASTRDYSKDNQSGYGNMSNTDLEHMLRSAKKDDSLYETDPNDSLFGVVSKAYKRNLSRILVLKSTASQDKVQGGDIEVKEEEISDKKKASLKNLLEAN